MGVVRLGIVASTVLAATLNAGCGHRARTASDPRPVASGPAASCADPSPLGTAPGVGGTEISGRGVGAQLHGLVFAQPPLRIGAEPLKIAWRMTGRGPLRARAFGADGREVTLAWGPESHGGSNYHRPGDEWGVGYRLPQPGCYRLTFARSVGRAEAWIRVRGRSS